MVGFPLPFAGSGMLPDAPPVPVSAAYHLATDTWDVLFDQRLRTRVIDHTNWTLRINNFTVTVLTAVIDQFYVRGTASKIAGPVQPNDCSYDPPPPDVENRRGTETVAFADFAMAVA